MLVDAIIPRRGKGDTMQATARKTYRAKLPKANSRGDVRPYVGDKKFTVGNVRDTTQAQMEHRLGLIRDLYDNYLISHWPEWIIPYIHEFGRTGKIVWCPPASSDDEAGDAINLRHFENLRAFGLPVQPEEQDYSKLENGALYFQRLIDTKLQAAVAEVVESFQHLQPGITERVAIKPHGQDHRSFHDALKGYKTHIRKNGKKKDNGDLARSPQNYLKWADKLKATHDDFPLMRFNKNKLAEITAYWRNREYRYKINGVEKPIGKEYAGHIMTCFWSFVKWLSDDETWNWKLPDGANNIDRKIIRLDSDRKKRQTRRIAGSVYNAEQLAQIASRLDTAGKLFLGLSVNCAMQPAESGRVEVGDYFTIHPETGKPGDFIIFDRPKTQEYGEWLLWPEVAELVKWGIKRSKSLGCDRLIVTDKGKNLYDDNIKQPSSRLSKWWQAIPTKASHHIGIVTRMSRDDPTFPRYVIKSLRKLLPSIIRNRRGWGKELADLANARKIADNGQWRGELADLYGDRPYDVLAGVLTELQKDFRPFLDALKID